MLLYPCDSPGKNTGVGSHSLLQGIFLPQESNPGLLHCRQIFTYWVMSEAHVYVTMCMYCKMITMVSLVNLHLTYRCFFHCDKIICLTTFKYRAHITHHAVPCILGASQVALVVMNLPVNAWYIRDAGSVPGSGRSPGGGHGNPLQYSCMENPMNRGAWLAAVRRITKSRRWLKWLSTHAFFKSKTISNS